jgi:hypothetical protein
MSKKSKKYQRNFAVLAFIIAFVFFGVEVFAVCTAKNQHDYDRAKSMAEELSVELGLVSTAFNSGNKKLYDDSVARYRVTLANFSENEYLHHSQPELLSELRDYSNTLKENQEKISEFLELSAALSNIYSELQLSDTEKLDATNFYHTQDIYQRLRDVLDEIESEELKDVKEKLDSFAQEIISLSENSAICVSVCPKSSFEEKQSSLSSIKEKYAKEFESISLDASKKFSPSELIIKLGKI